MGCTKCKQTYTFIQATSSRIAYGEEVEFTSFSYRRENHFQEWLNCFQAKESTTLLKKEAAAQKNREDTSVVEMVAQKCAEMGYMDRATIEMHHVREALKSLRLSKYYENQQQITTRISGRPAPTMTPQQEEQVRCMFSAIIPLFEKHKPSDRRNFLSYAYCLYKFCELMGWDQFLPCFTLLKGPDKLKKQMSYAAGRAIPAVVVLGPDEAREGRATLKNMLTGAQEVLAQQDLPAAIHKIFA